MASSIEEIQQRVYQALQDVLGYLPLETDDITDALDSLQRLEVLITLEEGLSVPFKDDALSADWWGSREGIVDYVASALADPSRL